MRIKTSIYESLTARERVIATVEALGRDDMNEVERLKKACPYKTYKQRDAAYADTMANLINLMTVVDCDLAHCALSYILTLRRSDDSADRWLQQMSNIQAAWMKLHTSLGIIPESLRAAFPPRHISVIKLLEDAPEAESKEVEEYYINMREQVFAC